VVTLGGDGFNDLTTTQYSETNTLTGTLSGYNSVARYPSRNAGGFTQAQVGLWDQLFLTVGLRAEWNPAFGEDANPSMAPRYGASYARDFETPLGPVTAKLRGSYGRSTRPPDPLFRKAQSMVDLGYTWLNTDYENFDIYLANPDLGPEYQQGGEGGIELYFGSRASLVVTRYNQTVDGLIASPKVDSARSLGPFPIFYDGELDADGYGYESQSQYLNIGSIRNQGWEAQGTLTLGPITTKGTYSWTKSRVIGITPKYRAALADDPMYQPGASFQFLPEHTWALGVTYANQRNTVALNFTGTGELLGYGNTFYYERLSSFVRLQANRYIYNAFGWNQMNRGYVLADLNATRRLSPAVDAMVQVQNIGDVYGNDVDASQATIGRQTKIGVRLRY
jgi:outer membrane cobalamin receptor